jgi:acyl carrier protein
MAKCNPKLFFKTYQQSKSQTMFTTRLAIQSSRLAVRNLSSKPFVGAFLKEDEVTGRVLTVLKTVKFVPSTVNAETKFADLDFDSLLKKDLIAKLSAEFAVKIPDEVTDGFHSVPIVVKYFSTHPKAR